MPDFNKGDFTQQGVNGHVNANVRLNEKRLVNIDLTSNEEAEGCTITGTVKDLLNDKVYGIGSGVSGNIEITENGENINVAPFATANVNVSGGVDLLHTTVNFVNERDSAYVPGVSLYGYAVNLHDFNANADNTLYSNVNDSPNMVTLADLSVSVPRNSTLTFNAYYHPDVVGGEFYPYITGISDNATGTNMFYEDGTWWVEDGSENSTISYVIAK